MKQLIILLIFYPLFSFAGEKNDEKSPVKFGKISAEDFDVRSDLIDSNTNAIIISDVGYSDFIAEMNKKKFTLEFKREKRLKLLNKNGFDAATVIIPLYTQGESTERLDKLKAYTYNLENGKVVKTSLESSGIFTEVRSRNVTLKKFTFPGIKEGSIIEFSYTVISDFLFNLQPWEFQMRYPCLWSEYNVAIPSFFNYLPMFQGQQEYFIRNTSAKEVTYTFRDESRVEPGLGGGRVPGENWELKGDLNYTRWVMKDVPALKEESYTTTVDNYISKVEFQLMMIQYPGTMTKNVMNDWSQVNKELMEDERFGLHLNRANNWLDDEVKKIIGNSASKLEKAQKIFAYVRDNFILTSYGYLSDEINLKTTFSKKKGNVAAINLLLISMLRHESINAYPVLLSTRSNGLIHPVYPLMDRFNYVICQCEIDSKEYYLDATESQLGFASLPVRCYNGNAKLISNEPRDVNLDPNTVSEKKTTSIFFINDEEKNYSGTLSFTYGTYGSLEFRHKIAKVGKETILKEIVNSYSQDYTISNLNFDSVNVYDAPLKLSYDAKWKPVEDILYFNPLFNEAMKENPFKSAKRDYPIEMPFTFDNTVIANLEIPNGYIIDEMPKSARVKLNEEEGMFEYIIGVSGNNIQIRTRLLINKAVFGKDDYNTLRDFYAYVIKKQSEHIVFKKK